MEIKFGKYKGQKVEDIARTEKGRGWLSWLVEQPTDGEYKDSNEKRNAYIRKVLSGKVAPDYGATMNTAAAKVDVSEKNVSDIRHEEIIRKLDTIINLLSTSGKGWDDEIA